MTAPQWARFWDVARKAGVAAACALSAALAMGLIPDRWTGYAVAALSVAGAYGLTYMTPNVPVRPAGGAVSHDPAAPVLGDPDAPAVPRAPL